MCAYNSLHIICTFLCMYAIGGYDRIIRCPSQDTLRKGQHLAPWGKRHLPETISVRRGSVFLKVPCMPVQGRTRQWPKPTAWSAAHLVSMQYVCMTTYSTHAWFCTQSVLLIYAALFMDAHFMVENPLQSLVPFQRLASDLDHAPPMPAVLVRTCAIVAAQSLRSDLQARPFCGAVCESAAA